MLLRSRARDAPDSDKKAQEPAIAARQPGAHWMPGDRGGRRRPYSIFAQQPGARRIMNLSLYLLTVLIWGTTWIAIKLQLGVVAIPVSIFYRFALAGLLLFAALRLMRKLQKLDRRGHWLCVGQGLCLFCLNFLCFYSATQWIPSGLVSVVFSAATLWNAVNARLWFGTRITARVMAAGALG
jgi:drug/metabolite transporter (DMT)-like permease